MFRLYIYGTQTDRFRLMAVAGGVPDEIGKAQVSLTMGWWDGWRGSEMGNGREN